MLLQRPYFLYLPLTSSYLFYFILTNCLWSICNWCPYHKIISAKLPLWPARGTWHAPRRVILSTHIFPGQCKLWQIPSSCIMCFMLISLILKNQEVLLFCWRAYCLIEWQENHICHPLLTIPAVATTVPLLPDNCSCCVTSRISFTSTKLSDKKLHITSQDSS